VVYLRIAPHASATVMQPDIIDQKVSVEIPSSEWNDHPGLAGLLKSVRVDTIPQGLLYG
jgi:hypothetical protein